MLEISKKKLPISKKLKKIIIKEKKNKLNSLKYWKNFNEKCLSHKKNLFKTISKLKESIAGYGASARSSTLINFCKIDNEKIKVIFDKNPLKHNLYTAGSNIKIIKPSKKHIKKFSNILILAWNFDREIVSYIKKTDFRGKLIIVLPKIKVVNVN